MKFIYGPVQSRRLGASLGISIIPHKTCDFNCIYCQLGKTTHKTKERKEYIKIEDILGELRDFLAIHKDSLPAINYITLSGCGEPTLNIKIKELIAGIKKISSIPLAVITNSSLLSEEALRQSICVAQLIVPSLDAVRQNIFEKINQPMEDSKIAAVIDGLIKLRRIYSGKIWLEIMLVRGVNDGLAHIREFQEVIAKINPDKIQLNSPVRATAEANILPITGKKLEKIKGILGDKCEIV